MMSRLNQPKRGQVHCVPPLPTNLLRQRGVPAASEMTAGASACSCVWQKRTYAGNVKPAGGVAGGMASTQLVRLMSLHHSIGVRKYDIAVPFTVPREL